MSNDNRVPEYTLRFEADAREVRIVVVNAEGEDVGMVRFSAELWKQLWGR